MLGLVLLLSLAGGPAPDFMQTSRSELPNGGREYCGPVAAANALAWLAASGYPSLLPGNDGVPLTERQFQLIRALGADDYMSTDPFGGTTSANLMLGLEAYGKERAVPFRTIRYQGWRPQPTRFSTDVMHADVDWIARGLDGFGNVLLNIGWYKQLPNGDRRRIGGHWVTLVGYENGAFLIHDPAPRSGTQPKTERVTFEYLSRGRLVGTDRGLPVDAAGYISLGGDLMLPNAADDAVLDGAIWFSP